MTAFRRDVRALAIKATLLRLFADCLLALGLSWLAPDNGNSKQELFFYLLIIIWCIAFVAAVRRVLWAFFVGMAVSDDTRVTDLTDEMARCGLPHINSVFSSPDEYLDTVAGDESLPANARVRAAQLAGIVRYLNDTGRWLEASQLSAFLVRANKAIPRKVY